MVETQLKVRLPDKARKQYETLEQHFITELDAGVVTAVNAAVLSGKLRQLAGGAVYSEDSDDRWAEVHAEKVRATVDRIEEAGEPTFVLYEFDHERERLANAFEQEGWSHARLTGHRSAARRSSRRGTPGSSTCCWATPQRPGTA